MKMKKMIALALTAAAVASAALTGCGERIDADAVVATLDEKDIKLGLANFMAQYTAASYDGYYLSSVGEDMWTQDLYGNGTTMTDSVKDGILTQLENDYLLEAHMSDYDIEITQDELDAMDQAADKFLADNSKKALKVMGAEKEYVTEMLRLNLIQQKMQEAVYATADINVTEEESAQRTFSYIKMASNGHYDDSNQFIEYTEDEKAEIAETAKQVAEAAKTDFAAAAEDNGSTVSTYSYGTDEIGEDGTAAGTMDAAVIAAADALKEGEISSLITVNGTGYFVLRLDSELDQEATDKKKDEIISKRKSDKYTEVLDGYKEDVKWEVDEKVWTVVNFDELYTIKQTESATEILNGTEETAGTEK